MTISESLKQIADQPDNRKQLLKEMMEQYPLEHLRDRLLTNIDFAMVLFRLFVETGLDSSEENTPSRNFFLKLTEYVFENATPEIKKAIDMAFNHCFPELKPIGFNEDGDIYSLNDLARELDVDPDKLLKEAKNLKDFDADPLDIPKGMTEQ